MDEKDAQNRPNIFQLLPCTSMVVFIARGESRPVCQGVYMVEGHGEKYFYPT
jgi:hypothetical protein